MKSNFNLFVLGMLVCTLVGHATKAQIPVNFDEFDKEGAIKANLDGDLLRVYWETDEQKTAYLTLNLKKSSPLIERLEIMEGSSVKTIATLLDPTFLVTVGKRNLQRNGWTVFFDNPNHRPYQTHLLQIEKEEVALTTDGRRCHIGIEGASVGPFSGKINIILYNGSPLIKVSAQLSSPQDSIAYLYDAGFAGDPWKEVFWSDTDGFVQNAVLAGSDEATAVEVKYRTIVGESQEGSLAIFPAPHQYFYPLDNAYNEKHTWYGKGYRGLLKDFGIGIRHDLMGDLRYVPWFNAPPGTVQDLNFFCLLSTQKDGKVLEEVKKYTHDDTYQPLDGYYTMSSHFHQEHTDDVITHKPLPETPGFVQAYRNTGVNIVHMGEFHLKGSPKGPDVRRLTEQSIFFEECARLSTGNFLLLPGEEPNNWLGGHWMSLFPKPVYWIMSKNDGHEFLEEDPELGKVYRISSKEEMLKLLELENGLAWTAHARIKGSIGYPDNYREEEFYKSEYFLGAAWKNMPADLSEPELGKRVLDLMDDMANWGQKKFVIAEADLFKIEPHYELYAHLNVNYLKLDKMPKFEEGWSSVIDALKQGQFFSTTGEILLPYFSVNGKISGETAALTSEGKANIKLKTHWTFPLNYVEIISGDGSKVYKEVISMNETVSFGEKEFDFTLNLKGRKWVRAEVWDVAANGAFTQIIWLK